MRTEVVRAHDVAADVLLVDVLGQVESRRVRREGVVGEAPAKREAFDDSHSTRVEYGEPRRRGAAGRGDDQPPAVAGETLSVAGDVRRRWDAPHSGERRPAEHRPSVDGDAFDRSAGHGRDSDIPHLSVGREHAEAALGRVRRPGCEPARDDDERRKDGESCDETVHWDPSCSRTSLLRRPRTKGSPLRLEQALHDRQHMDRLRRTNGRPERPDVRRGLRVLRS